jgi:hypothetical protein
MGVFNEKRCKTDKYIDKHLTPTHDVLEQRIPVSNGLKPLLQDNKIKLTTGIIDKFYTPLHI